MQNQEPPASGVTPRKVFGAVIVIAWVAFVLSYIIPMIRSGETESVVSVTPQHVHVHGAHGVRIPMDAITDVELKPDMPRAGRRVHGYNSVTCVKKGSFEVEGMGVGKTYIFTEDGPFLYVFAGDQFTIIGFEDPEKTRQLHDRIVSARE